MPKKNPRKKPGNDLGIRAHGLLAPEVTEPGQSPHGGEALRASEARYRNFFENAVEGIFQVTSQGRYISVNPAMAELLGYESPKALTEAITDIRRQVYVDPGRRQDFQRCMARDGFVKGFEYQIYRKDGSTLWISENARAVRDGNGNILYYEGFVENITARKQVEQELQAAALKWRSTFDAIGDAVCLIDRDLQIIQCNQAMVNLMGKPFTEIVGHNCWELVHGTARPIEGCPLGRIWKSQSRATFTYPRGDRWLHGMVDPILNEAGEVTGGVLIIADITRFKRAEDKIRDLNALLKAVKEINEALLRVKSEPELFQYICDLLVNVPYVRFTWIGLVEPGSFEVKPVAWAGVEDGYLSSIRVTWDDSSYGQGPTGTAIKTGQSTEVGDIDTDPRFLPWRREAQKRGYASSFALPLVYLGETLGNLSVYSGKKHAFGKEELEFLNQVAGDIAVGIRSLRLERGLEQSLRQVRGVLKQTVEAIASMAELRDPYIAGHQQKVSQLACALAAEMGLTDDQIEELRVAGFLHDIGKIVVPAEILNKPGRLSQYEFNLIRTHSQVGYDILQKIDFPWPVAQLVLQHHERLDGSGYPAGLTGSDILLEARILAVADVVEAMVSHRPYRPALGLEPALAEITKNKGILYDPGVVAACVKLFTQKKFRFWT